jgi:proton-translocating NAD(P)+ transhydrogenase subunit alpha
MVRCLAVIAAALAMTLPLPAFAAGGEISPFVYELMVFVIAIFVGYFVVWSVTPALHTPLMSVTNAISSVIVVGALLAVGVALIAAGSGLAKVFGFLALVMASVNIFGAASWSPSACSACTRRKSRGSEAGHANHIGRHPP